MVVAGDGGVTLVRIRAMACRNWCFCAHYGPILQRLRNTNTLLGEPESYGYDILIHNEELQLPSSLS